MKTKENQGGAEPAVENGKAEVARPRGRVCFGPFALDRDDKRLFRGGEAVALEPKAFDLLSHLVAHAGVLATKDQLLDVVWHEAYVSDAVLKVTVGDLRRALGDSARDPRWIQTVHRRGYRFIGEVVEGSRPSPAEPSPPDPVDSVPVDPGVVVGRDAVFRSIEELVTSSQGANRATLFLTGPPGAGKTAVVERVADHYRHQSLVVAHGQCRESYGEGEAYLPILEAVAGLCRGPHASVVLPILVRHAPSWLLQMPWVLEEPDRRAVEEAAQHTGRERMLREIADGFEELARRETVLLVLEDLHWSDPSTVDVISTLAHRTSPARLLVVGTYRPVDALRTGHPVRSLQTDLVARGRCQEISIGLLSRSDVAEYLAGAFGVRPPDGLIDLVHRRTDGNALFLTTFVRDLIVRACVVVTDDEVCLQRSPEEIEVLFPEELKLVLERHVESLEEEPLRLLECASVLGREFRADTVAALAVMEPTRVEEQLETFAGRADFVNAAGTDRTPEGGITGRYQFGHVLHRHAFYERIGTARRIDLHQRAAQRLAEQGASPAELAFHYNEGGLADEAIESWRRAGDVAIARKASVEAIGHFERALSLLGDRPAGPERDAAELQLLTAAGPQLGSVYGHGAPRVAQVYERARELTERVPPGPELTGVLAGLFQFYVSRARFHEARTVAQFLRRITEGESDALIQRSGLLLCGVASLYLGDLSRAHDELERTISMAEGGPSTQWGYLADGQAYAFSAQLEELRGHPRTAIERVERARILGVEAEDPFAETIGLHFGSVIRRWRRDVDATYEAARQLRAVASENGLEVWEPVSRFTLGWVQAQRGDPERGLEAMSGALEEYALSGNDAARTDYLAHMAEVSAATGDVETGLAAIDEALDIVETSGERFYEAELHRVRATLLATTSTADGEVEDTLRRAIEIALAHGARAWELRARASLYGVTQRRDDGDALRACLESIRVDGETPDVAAAAGALEGR